MKLLEPIFVVDDEQGILEVMGEILTTLEYEVRLFPAAAEALAAVKDATPFLILSDLRMPGMDGMEFCRRVRESHPHLPFVLVTAYADKDVGIQGLSSGLSDLLEKPLEIDKLKELVARFYQKRVTQRQEEDRETEEIISLFVEEGQELLGDLDQLVLRLEAQPIDEVVVDSLFRKVHSVKGGAAAIPGGNVLASLGHEFESVLALLKGGKFHPGEEDINVFLACGDTCRRLLQLIRQREAPSAEIVSQVESLQASLTAMRNPKGQPLVARVAPAAPEAKRPVAASEGEEAPAKDEGIVVPSDRLDDFMNLSGELIVLKNYFYMITREAGQRDRADLYEKRMQDFGYSLNKITDNLQEQIAAIRKVTLEKTFSKLPRIVRKTGQDVGKKVTLKMQGLELGVDKNIAKSLSTCMTHMIRNSIDHGIEPPEVRAGKGKSQDGNVEVSAVENQGVIQIVVSDDGAGIRRERVVAKAIQNGLLSEAQAAELSDAEAFDLIFLPGFSTAEKVTGVSGRGVGMDVVKSEILSHNGRIRIESRPDQGTTFTIDIPVAKAVMVEQTILTRSREAIFAIPLVSISRIVSLDQLQIAQMDHSRTCQFEGVTVQVRNYEEYLQRRDLLTEADLRRSSVVFMRHKEHFFGLIVDQIQDQLEAVIRPFDAIVRALPGFKGTTVLGNERIAYIVSPEHMSKLVRNEAA